MGSLLQEASFLVLSNSHAFLDPFFNPETGLRRDSSSFRDGSRDPQQRGTEA